MGLKSFSRGHFILLTRWRSMQQIVALLLINVPVSRILLVMSFLGSEVMSF